MKHTRILAIFFSLSLIHVNATSTDVIVNNQKALRSLVTAVRALLTPSATRPSTITNKKSSPVSSTTHSILFKK